MPVRLAVVQDHPLVHAGLRGLLAPYPDRVRLVADDLAQVTASGVDVVLHDPFGGLPGGVSVRRGGPGRTRPRVVVFSWRCEEHLVASALADGADGYLAKSCTAEQLVDAVERVHRGEQVRPGGSGGARDGRAWRGAEHGLSARESAVIALVCRGMSNADIAEHAYLSINTVKTYIRSGYRKIGATTRPQAVIWGLEHGFDTRSPPRGTADAWPG